MSKISLSQYSKSPFDSIRKVNSNGLEYWSGRDLMPILGYQTWHRFEDAIDRAKYSCENAGNVITEHFTPQAVKIISAGRPSEDCYLTRYGAYLVSMNGDPRKTEIAIAQTYFAMRTHEAETKQLSLFDDLVMLKETNKNLELQIRIKEIDLETLKIERGLTIAPQTFTATPQRTTVLSKKPITAKDGTVDLNKIVERFRGQVITARHLIRIRACKTAYEGEQILRKLAELGLGMLGRTQKLKPQLEIAAL